MSWRQSATLHLRARRNFNHAVPPARLAAFLQSSLLGDPREEGAAPGDFIAIRRDRAAGVFVGSPQLASCADPRASGQSILLGVTLGIPFEGNAGLLIRLAIGDRSPPSSARASCLALSSDFLAESSMVAEVIAGGTLAIVQAVAASQKVRRGRLHPQRYDYQEE